MPILARYAAISRPSVSVRWISEILTTAKMQLLSGEAGLPVQPVSAARGSLDHVHRPPAEIPEPRCAAWPPLNLSPSYTGRGLSAKIRVRWDIVVRPLRQRVRAATYLGNC